MPKLDENSDSSSIASSADVLDVHELISERPPSEMIVSVDRTLGSTVVIELYSWWLPIELLRSMGVNCMWVNGEVEGENDAMVDFDEIKDSNFSGLDSIVSNGHAFFLSGIATHSGLRFPRLILILPLPILSGIGMLREQLASRVLDLDIEISGRLLPNSIKRSFIQTSGVSRTSLGIGFKFAITTFALIFLGMQN